MKCIERYGAIWLISLATLTQTLTATASEDNNQITYVPSIGYQQKLLKFEQEYTEGSPLVKGRSIEFEADIPTINASFTIGLNKAFLTIKFEESLSNPGVRVDENTNVDNVYYLAPPGNHTEIERKDKNITLGYNVWNKLNLFIGYMKGETELKPQPSFLFTGGNPIPILNLAFDHYFDGLEDYRQNYEEQGPYVGISYSWQIANAGSLSFSAAYAKMDGEYQDNYASYVNEYFGFTGDSTGTSLGLTWTGPLGESSNYYIDMRRQKYSMDSTDDTGLAKHIGEKVSTDETMTGFTAGVQFYF